MPKFKSPAEVLARVKGIPDDQLEPDLVSVRVSGRVFRKIAEYGLENGLRDMSASVRAILEDWYQGQLAGKKKMDTKGLEESLEAKGKIVIDQNTLRELIEQEMVVLQNDLFSSLRRELHLSQQRLAGKVRRA
jgi:hypothetical protein